MKKRPTPKDKMIDCYCIIDYAGKPKPKPDCRHCKGTGKVRKRTNKSHVVWEGSDGRPIRIVLVDADTPLTLPCKVIIERGTKNATGRRNWSEIDNSNNLEKRLAWELAKALGGLPHWALWPEDEIDKTGAYR